MDDLKLPNSVDDDMMFIVTYKTEQVGTRTDILGVFTDTRLMIESIDNHEPNKVYWKITDERSFDNYARQFQICGFYDQQFNGHVKWHIYGYLLNDPRAVINWSEMTLKERKRR